MSSRRQDRFDGIVVAATHVLRQQLRSMNRDCSTFGLVRLFQRVARSYSSSAIWKCAGWKWADTLTEASMALKEQDANSGASEVAQVAKNAEVHNCTLRHSSCPACLRQL